MKKLFLSSLGAALILSNGFAYSAESEKINLASNLMGENTAEAVSLQGTAKALDAAILAGNVSEVSAQLNCLNALIGNKDNVLVKKEVQVIKGWIKNTTKQTEYIVNGRNSLINNVDVEMTLASLGFAKPAQVLNTDFTAKATYLESYLRVMTEILNNSDVSIVMIQAFHDEFKTNFNQLSLAGSKKTVDALTVEAQAAAIKAVGNIVVPQVTESWFGFGTKSKITLATAVILIGLASGKRTI